MVRISCPEACTAKVRQERPALPSISTVQAPQTPCSQPTWVPVRPELVAEEIGEEQANADVAFDLLAVDGDRDARLRVG